jgi:hypothetical protein
MWWGPAAFVNFLGAGAVRSGSEETPELPADLFGLEITDENDLHLSPAESSGGTTVKKISGGVAVKVFGDGAVKVIFGRATIWKSSILGSIQSGGVWVESKLCELSR